MADAQRTALPGFLLLMVAFPLLASCRPVPADAQARSNSKLRIGIVALSRNQLEEAENACTLAKQFNPRSPEAHNCLGLVAFRREQIKKADKLFKYAVYLSPDFAEARNNVGNVYFKRQNYTQAVVWFEGVIERVPCHLTARYNLALSLMQQRKWKLARQNGVRLRICLNDLKRNTAIAEYLLGLLEFQRKDYKRSLAHLQVALQTAPHHADASLLACQCQYLLSQFAQACQYCRHSLRLRQNHVPTQRAMTTLNAKLQEQGQRCQ